ncbi:MAG: helix-turn-helix domain-containing protein [Victivallaceae bacterium]|nr:helix-turn-helix domain-containing protein [Victivallaceae bacterium]
MTALREAVKARNIKQSTLAAKLGISKAAVSMQLKKGIKTMRTANKYGVALKCNPFFC